MAWVEFNKLISVKKLQELLDDYNTDEHFVTSNRVGNLNVHILMPTGLDKFRSEVRVAKWIGTVDLGTEMFEEHPDEEEELIVLKNAEEMYNVSKTK